MVKDITHVARLEKLLADARASDAGGDEPASSECREAGRSPRLLAAKFGSFLTFGALRSGAESAPGQPTLKQLRELYRVPAQSAATKVLGVIGNRSRSPSPPRCTTPPCARRAWTRAVPFLVDDLGAFLGSPLFGRDDYAGFSG